MIKNYFRVALRNLGNDKTYSLINTAGLAIGLAGAILISLWVRDEMSYDRFNPNASVLYRVNWDCNWNGEIGTGPGTPPPLAGKLVSDIQDIKAATRLRPMLNTVVRYGDKFFDESGIVAADSNFLQLFPFTMVEGNPSTALVWPNTVVLTESIAHKLFGDGQAVGKILIIGKNESNFYGTYQSIFKVTGVVKDVPQNSTIQFDMLTSMKSYPEVAWRNWSWVWMQVVTYAELRKGASPVRVQSAIRSLEDRYLPAGFTRFGSSYKDMIKSGGFWHFLLQPLTDVYLGSSSIGNRLGPTGDRDQVYLFSVIAVLLLVIASINFMNISTARLGNRAKEIGVRKVLGSTRGGIVIKVMVEALLSSFIALGAALILVELSLHAFNQLTGKELAFDIFRPWWESVVLFLLTVIVGLLSGSYPGVYLSSMMPIKVLKSTGAGSRRKGSLRNFLVVIQFSVAIGLIICTLIVYRQMEFVQQANLGFNKTNLVIISNQDHRLGDQAYTYRDIVRSNADIINSSITTGVPPIDFWEDGYAITDGKDKQFEMCSYTTDDNFISTMGLQLLMGRGFSPERNDSASVILNEAAVKYLGFNHPLGEDIVYTSNGARYKVIGVVKNFNFQTLYSPITPFALFHHASKGYSTPSSYVVVRVKPDNLARTISMLKSEWQSVAPSEPFEYTFLDQNFTLGYQSAQRTEKVFLIFSLLTVVIACLGLFALASFVAEQRTKEIGIRKVLGASVTEVIVLLSTQFVRWVLIANVIAWPLAYIVMNKWLQDFAYKTSVDIWIFVGSGILALVVALLTVSVHAVKAATANPVESLRYE
jgi:putative ABC transport system permease protein